MCSGDVDKSSGPDKETTRSLARAANDLPAHLYRQRLQCDIVTTPLRNADIGLESEKGKPGSKPQQNTGLVFPELDTFLKTGRR